MADTAEPHLRQEDILAFLKSYSPERKLKREKDMLAGRWRIVTAQPLAELSSPFAKAYAASDEKTPEASLYALVFDDATPMRQKNIAALKAFRHPALAALVADGVVQTGPSAQTHYAAILERPKGTLLSAILARRDNPLPETLLLQHYLRPLAEMLVGFAKLGISHNRIHPGNLYISGNQVTLGDCISEPSGFSQNYLFEPIERALALPYGKADFAPGADCYALAILAVHLALGYAPFEQVDKEAMLHQILNAGAYHALVLPWDMPAALQDFLRGMLGDSRRERWDAATLEGWLGGRRFNLVMPSSAAETNRGFEFADETHLSRKSLAHGLHQHWREALPLVGDHRISRWVKMHIHKTETSDLIAKIAVSAHSFTPHQEEEALARIIIALDPHGPLRFRQLSIAPEALGAQLARSFIAERHDEVQLLTQIMDADLPGFWIEQQKPSHEWTALTAKLQKARSHMRMKAMGFGMERALYDLNPGLACLSPLLQGQHVTTLSELLAALDAVSPQKAAAQDPGDRHIAAFIASRLDMNREIHFPEFQALPSLKNHPALLLLRLLTMAQAKVVDGSYKGLSHWITLKLLPLLSGMHGHARKRKLASDLKSAMSKGSPDAIASLLITPASFEADRRDFQKAARDYSALAQRISELQGTGILSLEADRKGYGVAQSLAYGICIATVYVTLKAYFHL